MGTFRAYYTDIHASDWQQQAAAQLRELGLLTFSGIAERARLIGLARQLMTIRPHRDADAEGVMVITKTRDESSGYAGFTDAELIPHTDGSAESNPPGLLLGRFTDEIAIVADLHRPLAILQGESEQLVSLDYLNKLATPTLWRGEVQVIPAAGHALHQEAPEAFTALLDQFIADLS